MSTYNINDAAIEAAAEKLAFDFNLSPSSTGSDFFAAARAVLAAALPLLGDQTEYGVRVTNQTGLTFTYGPYGDIEVADARMTEVKPEWKPRLIQRPAWHGEWTEVTE